MPSKVVERPIQKLPKKRALFMTNLVEHNGLIFSACIFGYVRDRLKILKFTTQIRLNNFVPEKHNSVHVF